MILVRRKCALHIAIGCRNVSAVTVMVMTGVICIDLVEKDRKKIYECNQMEDDRIKIRAQEGRVHKRNGNSGEIASTLRFKA